MVNEALRAFRIKAIVNDSSILNGLSLELFEREILGIIGLSNSGKDIIPSILSGGRVADEGKLFLFDKEVITQTDYSLLRSSVFVVNKDAALINELSVAENMCIMSKGVGEVFFDAKKACATASKWMEAFGVGIDPRSSVRRLSVCQKLVIKLIAAHVNGAKVIVADHILSLCTEREREKLSGVVETLRNQGMSIIIIDDLRALFNTCDRLIAVRNGKSVGNYYKNETTEDDIVGLLGDTAKNAADAGERDRKTIFEISDVEEKETQRPVSLNIKEGEVVAVFARESVISAVLGTLAGRSKSEKGILLVDGRAVSIKSTKDAVKLGVCVITGLDEKSGVFPNLSVLENICIMNYPRIKNRFGLISNRLRRYSVKHIAEDMDIPPHTLALRMSELSADERFRVLVGRCLCANPRLLVIYEPFLYADMDKKSKYINIIKEVAAKGVSVLLLSAARNEQTEFCDVTYMFYDN